MPTEKLYHADAALQQFTGCVLRCTPAEGGYAVVLDRTAFYATAGGQPHDTGTLGTERVLQVDEDEATGDIVHLVAGAISGEVTGAVDWERRRDHTEQHTGQHLLSQAFVQALGAETVSFHMGEAVSTIDLNIESLTLEQVDQVECLANAVIRENRQVVIHVTDAEGARSFPLRKPPTVDANIRIVAISGFDWSACGGTHVVRTGELGLIKIKSWERAKRQVRVEFLVGGRALANFQAVDTATRELCRSLSVGLDDLPGAVGRLRDESQRLRKQVQQLTDQALAREAEDLLASAHVVGGMRLVRHVFVGRPLDEVKLLAAKVARHSGAVAVFGLRGALPHLLLSRSPDVRGVDVGAVLREALPVIDGKGGGSLMTAQGAGTRPDGFEQAFDLCVVRVAEALGL